MPTDPLTLVLTAAIVLSASAVIYLLVCRPEILAAPVDTDRRVWTYRTGISTVPRLVSAYECVIDDGRVTWRDIEGRIVLSLPSDQVHALSCHQAEGDATDRIRPEPADSCTWCRIAVDRGRFDNRPDGVHFPDCPHRRAR